jgi:hypothetical protein
VRDLASHPRCSSRRPVVAADVARTDHRVGDGAALRYGIDILLHCFLRVVFDRLAALGVEPLGSGHFVDEGRSPLDLTVVAIER